MLVISRKQNQRLKLGDSIVLTVVRVAGGKVRLGIEAPSDIRVLREELEPIENLPLGVDLDLAVLDATQLNSAGVS